MSVLMKYHSLMGDGQIMLGSSADKIKKRVLPENQLSGIERIDEHIFRVDPILMCPSKM
jgi:hypothetical protein